VSRVASERSDEFLEPPSSGETNRWLVLVIVCLAQFMVILDATVVNVALPSIQRDLGFTASSLQWVINAYTLVFGGFLLLGGRAGDLFGRRRLFLWGVAISRCSTASRSRSPPRRSWSRSAWCCCCSSCDGRTSRT
jgi:MFS family permease